MDAHQPRHKTLHAQLLHEALQTHMSLTDNSYICHRNNNNVTSICSSGGSGNISNICCDEKNNHAINCKVDKANEIGSDNISNVSNR